MTSTPLTQQPKIKTLEQLEELILEFRRGYANLVHIHPSLEGFMVEAKYHNIHPVAIEKYAQKYEAEVRFMEKVPCLNLNISIADNVQLVMYSTETDIRPKKS